MSPAKKASKARSGASSKAAKSTTKKSSVKKAAAKKTTAKRPAKAAKKTAARKNPAKKTAAKKTAAKKTAAKKNPAKKPAPKKPAKKTAAKKTAPKKTAAKKTAAPKKASASAAKAKPAVRKPAARPAPPAPPKKKVRAAKFTPDQLKKIRASLLEKKDELEDRQRELDESSFDSTQSDITGEVGIDEDFADAGTATFERERDLSIRNNIRDLIDQVTRSVQRIDDGKYGLCERCGNPIDATRLRELPHASLCLDCKRREERAR
jgi:RNA polymerase-binding protein DksA